MGVSDKKYPAGSNLQNWFLAKDGDKFAIRRMVILPDGKKKLERLPLKKHSHIPSARISRIN